jgi:hypothetical protein
VVCDYPMADWCVGDGDEACCAWCGGTTGTAGRLRWRWRLCCQCHWCRRRDFPLAVASRLPVRPDHCSQVLAGFLIACERLVELCGDLRVGSRLLHAHLAHAAVELLVLGRVSARGARTSAGRADELWRWRRGRTCRFGRRWRSGSRPLPWLSPHPLCTWSSLVVQ